MVDSQYVREIKKLKNRIKDYTDKCSVIMLVKIAKLIEVKIPQNLLSRVNNEKTK